METVPANRWGHAVAYDRKRHLTVLQGGYDYSNKGLAHGFDDTWTWDGSKFARVSTSAAPELGLIAWMAFDPVNEKVLDVEGTSDHPARTWLFDGSDWTNVPTVHSPTTPYGGAVAEHVPSRTVVLVVPHPADNPQNPGAPESAMSETWVWDGNDWAQKAVGASPPGYLFQTLSMGPGGKLVWFGGQHGADTTNETWTWDGSSWTKENPPTSPPGRRNHTARSPRPWATGSTRPTCRARTNPETMGTPTRSCDRSRARRRGCEHCAGWGHAHAGRAGAQHAGGRSLRAQAQRAIGSEERCGGRGHSMLRRDSS